MCQASINLNLWCGFLFEFLGKENFGWSQDSIADLPGTPVRKFNIKSMEGTWFKVVIFRLMML
jgi:hypothetical protein